VTGVSQPLPFGRGRRGRGDVWFGHGINSEGGGESVRRIRSRHAADRVHLVLPMRDHPWPSHCWQPPVATDILSASRGRSRRSSRIWTNRSSRHPSRPHGAHPPTGASSCRPMTTATSCKRHPTNCPQSISTASERERPQAAEAPGTFDWDAACADARKQPLQGGSAAFW
jgi:hypothetical protein